MVVDIILGPDVYVNAAVALGSPPDHVVQRLLGGKAGQSKSTDWILERVKTMLKAHEHFKDEAIDPLLDKVRSLVQVVDVAGLDTDADWEKALVASAKAADVKRVVTDHPDLLAKESVGGVEFLGTDVWLVEQSIPPPPPGS